MKAASDLKRYTLRNNGQKMTTRKLEVVIPADLTEFVVNKLGCSNTVAEDKIICALLTDTLKIGWCEVLEDIVGVDFSSSVRQTDTNQPAVKIK